MFRTELPLTPSPQQLPLSARVLTIGSCFSDTIGARLATDKVNTLVNPFGTVFNPLSACKLLRAAAGEDVDWQQHVVEARGRWQSYDLHASIGADSPVDLLQDIQRMLRDTGVFLATADVVVLTLGTAFAYRLTETDELVSNCHKLPADKFQKELLTPDEIINAVAETHAYLRLRNPKLRFVLTVSPVRHLKDTLPLNSVSKSVLRVACHYLSELLPDVSYFPAYELLLDDLRDYRFYAADMLHPSEVAEDYIWERFARTYFDVDFGRFRKEWDAVRRALAHRPLHEAAPEHRQFLETTLEKLERLAVQADMRMEILDVRRRIENLPQPKPQPEPIEPEDDEERIDIGEAESAVLAPVHYAPTEWRRDAQEPAVAADDTEDADGSDDTSAETQEPIEELSTDDLQPKKKRRSRGGAKRNKKKHAARLAAEAGDAGDILPVTNSVALEAAALLDEPEAVKDLVSIAEDSLAAESIDAAADAPAAEARRGKSRRSRGRRGRGGQSAEAQNQVPEAQNAPSAPDEAAEAVAASFQTEPEEVTLFPALDDTAAAPAPERPVRTGRSASEVRAAAVRKPRRPASRIKTLYATDETGTTPAAESDSPADTAVRIQDSTDAGASAPFSPAPAPSAPARPVMQPTVIPDTKGTGASGKLSESGQASRRSGTAQPRNDRPVSTSPIEAAPVADNTAAGEALGTEAVETDSIQPVSNVTTDAAVPEAEPPKAAKPRRSAAGKPAPKRAPAKPTAPTKATVTPDAQAPPAASAPEQPAPAKPAGRAKRKAPAKSAAATSVDEPATPQAESGPDATAAPAPPAKPKRPARRKPGTAENPAETT